MNKFSMGLDFGTNSVRTLIVDTATGEEVAASVFDYESGEAGIVLDSRDPNLARQHPGDYLKGLDASANGALTAAARHEGFSKDRIIGIGVDATGSTPLPLNGDGLPLALAADLEDEPNAMAWLWKDHSSHAEAEEITARAAAERPRFLAKCGGTYSSEWFWSKILHCSRVAPRVFDSAHTWVELADWIPAVITGTTRPGTLKRGICAAGHKAMFHTSWGGYPDEEFLGSLDPGLVRVRGTLPARSYHVAQAVGTLTPEWAGKLGLAAGIPVAAGAIDAHLGAVGSGIRDGVLVKIMGTSTCDMAVKPMDSALQDIPGLCGIVPESILPGFYGLEAGQAAVGDLFNWFVNRIAPGGSEAGSHEALTGAAEALSPGESGLLCLDWHNGNRTVLADQRLTGLVAGMTLHTTPAEIYRALIEATAFGARVILERFVDHGVKIDRVVNCGGISVKNPMVMQIYADVMNRPLEISRSSQTCALGAAMAGAVVAGGAAGGHDDFSSATAAMTGIMDRTFQPDRSRVAVYDRLYRLYRELHDVFGTEDHDKNQFEVMKELLNLRDEARGL